MVLFITQFVVTFLFIRNGAKPATNVERRENLKHYFLIKKFSVRPSFRASAIFLKLAENMFFS
jgi:hypothetical protein